MVIFDVIPVVFVEASFDEKKMHFSSFVKKLHFFFKVENLKRFIELGAINKTQNSNNKLGFFCASAKIKWLYSYFNLQYEGDYNFS